MLFTYVSLKLVVESIPVEFKVLLKYPNSFMLFTDASPNKLSLIKEGFEVCLAMVAAIVSALNGAETLVSDFISGVVTAPAPLDLDKLLGLFRFGVVSASTSFVITLCTPWSDFLSLLAIGSLFVELASIETSVLGSEDDSVSVL